MSVSAPPRACLQEMLGRVEVVTPTMAREWLAMSRGNRKIRQHRVDQIASDIERGAFYPHHQGVAFDRSGVFIDGHHRMHAIIKANRSVRLFVVRDSEPDALAYVDSLLPRTVRDGMAMAGASDVPDPREEAIARFMPYFPVCPTEIGGNRATRDQIIHVFTTHREAIRWAASVAMPKSMSSRRTGGVCKGTRCALARAYYYLSRFDRDELSRVLATGLPETPRDNGLVPWLLFMANNKVRGGGDSMDRYQRAQAAIRRFMNHEVSKMCKPVKHDLFPYTPNATPSDPTP